jgi:hypothetical protein
MYYGFICRERSQKNWITGRILKVGMGKLGDHAKISAQAKKKFASAIKLRPADRCVAIVPGNSRTRNCVQLNPGKGYLIIK